MNLSFLSRIALLFDFSIQLRSILAPLLPSGEHIGGIRIKTTWSFSPSSRFWEGAFFLPIVKRSGSETDAPGNLRIPKPLRTKSHDLSVSIMPFCTARETRSLGAGIGSRFPILYGDKLCGKTKFFHHLSFFF